MSNTVADRNLDQTQTELEVAKRDQEEELKNPIKQIDELKIKLQLQEVLVSHMSAIVHVRSFASMKHHFVLYFIYSDAMCTATLVSGSIHLI